MDQSRLYLRLKVRHKRRTSQGKKQRRDSSSLLLKVRHKRRTSQGKKKGETRAEKSKPNLIFSYSSRRA